MTPGREAGITDACDVRAEARMEPFEFVAFVAASMVVGAMGTDMMLPALGAITDDLALHDANLSQAAIAAFLLGVGLPQLVFGPASDRYGRRPLFLGGLALFIAGGLLAAAARDLPLLLAARLLQGLGAGAQRGVTIAIVRDRHAGLEMARVMSLAMAVLLLEPILAPLAGQLVLLVAGWRWIPGIVAVAGMMLLAWAMGRMDESLPAARRRPLRLTSTARTYREILGTRVALANMLGFGFVMGAHLGFLTSAQAIFQRAYDTGLAFTPLLALVSLGMPLAALANARLVRRHGAVRLVFAALCALLVINIGAAAANHAGTMSLAPFLVVQSANMLAFGFLAPNMTTLAVQPLGHVVGAASALFGSLSTSLAALLGLLVGQCFDGTPGPMFVSYIVLAGAAMGLQAWSSAKTSP